jgi:NAD(P)-dependent dehydrogenase (short-subunit alcohol dehydrogenase family)
MRTIVVTGGTGGLGPTVVTRLARDYRCIVLYREEASWEALRKVVNVEGIDADLLDEADAQRAISEAGDLYAIVHLVGGFTTDANAWSKMIALNFTTAVNAINAAVPHIERGGRVVAISSYASISRPAGLGAYVASKGALNAFIATLAVELKARRITANAILPDDLGSSFMRERTADLIAFLLSESASNITGALIPMLA